MPRVSAGELWHVLYRKFTWCDPAARGESWLQRYGLAMVVEILGGIVTRAGCAGPEPGGLSNSIFTIVIDISAFVGPSPFRREIDDLLGYVKSVPKAPGAVTDP